MDWQDDSITCFNVLLDGIEQWKCMLSKVFCNIGVGGCENC